MGPCFRPCVNGRTVCRYLFEIFSTVRDQNIQGISTRRALGDNDAHLLSRFLSWLYGLALLMDGGLRCINDVDCLAYAGVRDAKVNVYVSIIRMCRYLLQKILKSVPLERLLVPLFIFPTLNLHGMHGFNWSFCFAVAYHKKKARWIYSPLWNRRPTRHFNLKK